MSFRTVVIKNRCKLEYSLNYMVVRNEEGEKRILLDEISTLMIQSTGVALTTALISNLAEKNIKDIFCDAKSNPQSELISYFGTYDSQDKLETQFNFTEQNKRLVWKRIVQEKIRNQARVLNFSNLEEEQKLLSYIEEVLDGDDSNREGHAAKVYFNALFGKDFFREKNCDENMYLDYGYTIILSCFNRIIKSLGFYTELGIHHKGRTNYFNLSCDFMEPLRPLVDSKIIKKEVTVDTFKNVFINMLNEKVIINNQEMYLENAVKVYVQSLINSLISGKVDEIKFVQYEL